MAAGMSGSDKKYAPRMTSYKCISCTMYAAAIVNANVTVACNAVQLTMCDIPVFQYACSYQKATAVSTPPYAYAKCSDGKEFAGIGLPMAKRNRDAIGNSTEKSS